MYQYFEDAIEPENRDLEEKVIFPSKSTFKGRRWDGWDENSRERAIESAESRIVLTHNDADGLVSGALFYDYFEGDVEIISIDYGNIESTFEYIASTEHTIDEIYVSDLNIDEVYPIIEKVANQINVLVWLDHHEWGSKEEEVSEMGVDITINQERAAAGIVHQYLLNRGYTDSQSIRETVQLTEDHDLWNHEMKTIMLGEYEVCISQAFSQIAFYSDDNKFIENILDYGINFMDYEGELLREGKDDGFIAEREAEHKKKVNYIIENEADIKSIGEFTVAFAHGRASPGDLLEELFERENVEILVHTKPAYPVKASIRSKESFDLCHKLAEKFDGGGHKNAAGCTPDMAQKPMEFITYIQNHGNELQKEMETELKKLI